MGVDLGLCSLAPRRSGEPGCDWCGAWLNTRQKRWCSDLCISHFRRNHVWKFARVVALNRDAGCTRCSGVANLEVNHIVPLAGQERTESCLHHLSNLEVLCHSCHVAETAAQRERGDLPASWGNNLRRS